MKRIRRYSVEKEAEPVVQVSEMTIVYQPTIRSMRRPYPGQSRCVGIQNLSEALQNMMPEEILESQRQWWKRVYSSEAVHSRMTSVLSGRASESKWLTAEEADEEVGRNLPWLR